MSEFEKNILITSAGQRVSLVGAFKKELKTLFPEGKVFTTDRIPLLAPACHISDQFIKVPAVTDINYIDELLKICIDLKVEVVVPTIDTELLILAENKNKFKQHGINLIISDLEFVKKCRDKRLTSEFFFQNNLNTPKLYSKESLLHCNFPIFVKPYDGSLSVGAQKINKYEDITEAQFENEKLLYMEYIDNTKYSEYTIDVYYNLENKATCIVPRKRIVVRSGEVSKAVTKKNKIVDYLMNCLAHLPGVVGCITIQVFFNEENEDMIAIEINPRFGGGYPLSYFAGANFPKWIIQEYILGNKMKFYSEWEEDLLMLRYDAEVLYSGYK